MNRNLYGIMIKYPEPGRVKTRLATDIGHEKAVEICRQVTEQVMNNTVPFNQYFRRIVFYDPPERSEDFIQWLGHEQFIPQQGSDVGERMNNAIRELLACGAKKAVLTGTDIPALNSTIISSAFSALDHADIVIGPAADGGYYLIGMKEPHGELFRDIPWSTERVFETTASRIRQLGLSVSHAVKLADIDRVEDLKNLFGSHSAGEQCSKN